MLQQMRCDAGVAVIYGDAGITQLVTLRLLASRPRASPREFFEAHGPRLGVIERLLNELLSNAIGNARNSRPNGCKLECADALTVVQISRLRLKWNRPPRKGAQRYNEPSAPCAMIGRVRLGNGFGHHRWQGLMPCGCIKRPRSGCRPCSPIAISNTRFRANRASENQLAGFGPN
jgi:hypothetical protein